MSFAGSELRVLYLQFFCFPRQIFEAEKSVGKFDSLNNQMYLKVT